MMTRKGIYGFSLIEMLLVLMVGGIVLAGIYAAMGRNAEDDRIGMLATEAAQDAARFARAVREFAFYTPTRNITVVKLNDLQDANLLPRRNDGATDDKIIATGQKLEGIIVPEDGAYLVFIYPAGNVDRNVSSKFAIDGKAISGSSEFGKLKIFANKVAFTINDRFPAPNSVAGVIDTDGVMRGLYGSFEMDVSNYLGRRREPYFAILMTLPKG